MATMTLSSCADHHRSSMSQDTAAGTAPDDIHFEHDNARLSWRKAAAKETDSEYIGHLDDDEVVLVTSDPTVASGYVIYALEKDDSSSTKLESLKHLHAPTLPEDYLEKFLLQQLPSHLSIPTSQAPSGSPEPNIHVVVSIKSGIEQAETFYDTTLGPFLKVTGLKEGKDYIAYKTESTHSVKEYARNVLLPRANEGFVQTLILLSGDGGIVDVINGLFGSQEKKSSYIRPTVALLPLGTANALFHSLRRNPENPTTITPIVGALRGLYFGRPRPLPIFQSTFSSDARILMEAGEIRVPVEHDTLYGAVVASYGLHSTLVADSDTTEWRKHGSARFGMVAKELVFPGDGSEPHKYKADLYLFAGGQETPILNPRTQHTYILSTLVSNLESTFPISPASRPLDRQLRILHFDASSGEEIMNIMKKVGDGGHISEPGVSYETIDGMRIVFKESGEDYRWRRVCIDGTAVAMGENGWMVVKTLSHGEEAVDILTLL